MWKRPRLRVCRDKRSPSVFSPFCNRTTSEASSSLVSVLSAVLLPCFLSLCFLANSSCYSPFALSAELLECWFLLNFLTLISSPPSRRPFRRPNTPTPMDPPSLPRPFPSPSTRRPSGHKDPRSPRNRRETPLSRQLTGIPGTTSRSGMVRR